ncbi:MAG: PhoH family protein [Candidatus Pacearchaeota archaeon]|jgi:predicted ribonuclease YlaK
MNIEQQKEGVSPTSVYHEVRIPLLDIYQDAGSQTFDVLSRPQDNEKNLIIFPAEYRHELVPQKNNYSRVRRVSGTSTLEALSESEVVYSDENYSLFSVNPGLDVAYMKVQEYISPKGLVERVTKDFGKSPVVITDSKDETVNYKSEKVSVEKPKDFILCDANIIYRGRIQGPEDLLSALKNSKTKSLEIEEAKNYMPSSGDKPFEFYFNQILEFSVFGGPYFAMVMTDENNENQRIELLDLSEPWSFKIGEQEIETVCGTKPNKLEQYVAMKYGILNPKIKSAFVPGTFGTGKTFLALAGGLESIGTYTDQIQESRGLPTGKNRRGFYRQIAIFRPNDPIGGKKRATPALPGNLWKKTEHQFGSFISAYDSIRRSIVRNDSTKKLASLPTFEQLLANPSGGKSLKLGDLMLPKDIEPIQLYSFADIQGCNFDDLFVIIDEAENLTYKESKHIYSRACENTKFVVIGDPEQVVNEECTEDRNGYTSAIRHYHGFPETFLFNLIINNRGIISRRASSWKS